MEKQVSEKPIYFANLDILRFIAAFIVLFAHAYEGYCGWFGIPQSLAASDPKQFSYAGGFVDQFIRNGGFGVDLFFMISGFLITFILIKEKQKTGTVNFPKFFMRRAIRIWPVYFLAIALAPLAIHLAKSPSTPDYWANIFFYNNFHAIYLKDTWEYPFAHFWSICVEEHFYLIWPLLIAFVPLKHLKNTFFILLTATVFFRLYAFLNHWNGLELYLNTFARIDILIVGAMFALYFSNNQLKLSLTKVQRLCLYLIFIALFATQAVYETSNVVQTLFAKYVFCLIAGIGMVYFIFSEDKLFKVPFRNILNYFGRISFGIYLFSNMLIPIIVQRFMYKWGTHNMWVYFFLNVFLSILISAIVYELYEKQFLKLKKYFEIIKTKRTDE